MTNEINAVDLAFIVDTTGSMGTLIAAAQRHMMALMESMSQAAAIDLHFGMVEYRDHPPQDKSFVARSYDFTANLSQAQNRIKTLAAGGGGDGPESVLDGVMAACKELTWRQHARRLAVLVGDAPPHGVGTHGDGFATGCPCGESIESVTFAAEEKSITIHALGLTTQVTASFGQISRLTGGTFFAANEATATIEQMATILKAEFGDLEFDRKVLAAWQADPDATTDALVEEVGGTRFGVSAALVRLASRDLLELPTPAAKATGIVARIKALASLSE